MYQLKIFEVLFELKIKINLIIAFNPKNVNGAGGIPTNLAPIFSPSTVNK